MLGQDKNHPTKQGCVLRVVEVNSGALFGDLGLNTRLVIHDCQRVLINVLRGGAAMRLTNRGDFYFRILSLR